MDASGGSGLRRATDELIAAVRTEGTALSEVRERLERLREEAQAGLAAETEAQPREEPRRT